MAALQAIPLEFASGRRPAADAAKPSVLFVDDEEMVLRTMQILFRKDYNSFTAGGGEQALDILGKREIDVVVSDERMPHMTGVELLREVARRSPATTRILLTGYADADAVVRSINEGEVYRFVTKPWDNTYLRDTVRRAAEHAQEVRAHGFAGRAPASRPSETGTPPAAIASHPSAAGGKVPETASLMVLDAREDLALAVRTTGCRARLVPARSLREADELFDRNPVDAIVTEMYVAGQPVTELLHRFKSRQPSVMSVVVAGDLDFPTVQQLINHARVYRFFRKPIRPGLLRLSIESALLSAGRIRNLPHLAGSLSVDALPTFAAGR